MKSGAKFTTDYMRERGKFERELATIKWTVWKIKKTHPERKEL